MEAENERTHEIHDDTHISQEQLTSSLRMKSTDSPSHQSFLPGKADLNIPSLDGS